jgi:RNA polymerase primary sigma factor
MAAGKKNPAQILLESAKIRGFIHYGELASILSDASSGEAELDQVLSQLEEAQIQVLPNQEETQRGERLPTQVCSDPLDDPLQIYLREVAKVPGLPPDRESYLVQRMEAHQTDAEAAKKELVEAHLGLVIDIAQRYRLLAGMHILDAIQRGNEGLVTAAGTFKQGRGYKFSTYATVCVHRSLHDWLQAKKG